MPEPIVQPFRGLRPVPDKAQAVAAPPYDVLSTEEARELAKGNPLSFLHISKPEIDLPAGTDAFAPEVYETAAKNITRMVGEGVLVRDVQPCYYVYRVAMDGHVQTGIAAAGSVAAYEANLIRRHEFTRPDKEDDRVRQIEAVNAQTGPVFTVHKANDQLSQVISETVGGKPAYAVRDVGGADHTLWVVSDPAAITQITDAFNDLGVIYIADGHHRSAAAARVAHARADLDNDPQVEDSYNRFLLVSFPEDEMQILDYNRVVRDLNGMEPAAFLEKVGEAFVVAPSEEPVRPGAPQTFGMYLGGKWYKLSLKTPVAANASAVQRLDVSLLSDRLIEPILGIADPRRDARIDFVGGRRGLDGLAKRVDQDGFAVAFSMYPTSIHDLMAVADAGAVMPPKSTWFEPKLADGMVSLVLD